MDLRAKRMTVLGGAIAILVAAALPPFQARAKAVGLLAASLDLPWPRPFARDVTRSATTIDGVAGDLYVSGGEAPPIVLVHGAATQGKDDPRLVRLARALAEANRTVFVPDLQLKNRTFDEEDIERIVRAIKALPRHEAAAGRAQVLGISYGGAFALIAAADERVRSEIEQVATFGAYFDLVGYVQGVTTSTSLVAGRRISWEEPEQAEEILHRVAPEVAPQEDRADLRAALEGRLQPEDLQDDTERIYRFLTNEDPGETYELARRLPDTMAELLATFSPSTVAGDIQAPVIAMHSKHDPAVPYGEGVRLHTELAGARLVTLELFRHVDLEGSARDVLPDLVRAWKFTSWVVAAQEDLF